MKRKGIDDLIEYLHKEFVLIQDRSQEIIETIDSLQRIKDEETEDGILPEEG